MGILRELREAAPLAEALANATLDAAEGLRQAAIAAATIQVPTAPAAPTRASAPLSSSGGGGAGATGGGGGGAGSLIPAPQLVRAVDRSLQPRTVDWLNAHCERTTFKIPNPRNRNAAAENDMVTIGGWDCSGELHMVADFYDPAEMARLTGADKRMSSRGSGGGASGGGTTGGGSDLWLGGGSGGNSLQHVGGSSSAPTGPSRPSGPVQVTDPAMAEQTRLLREIRDQGRQDGSLSRRVGGRP